MKKTIAALALLGMAASIVATPACSGTSRHRKAAVLEYLYPEGKDALPAEDVHLEVPVTIGLAFVPEILTYGEGVLTPGQQEKLLRRVQGAFVETEEIARIEIIPTSYVTPAGGFENVDQIRSALGVDLIVLVSFDQTQFDDPNLASITYWTIVGAYVVPGNVNETHTFVHASAFDIESHALLMNASGKSVVEDKATPIDLERSLREDRIEGFELAVEDLIVNLGTALGQFREQVKTGTVRGQGTPAVEVTGRGGVSGGGAGVGVGAFGPLEVALGLLLLAVVRTGRRAGRRA